MVLSHLFPNLLSSKFQMLTFATMSRCFYRKLPCLATCETATAKTFLYCPLPAFCEAGALWGRRAACEPGRKATTGRSSANMAKSGTQNLSDSLALLCCKVCWTIGFAAHALQFQNFVATIFSSSCGVFSRNA